jgi:hypothetical protein
MAHWPYTRVIRPSISYGALEWWFKVTQKTTKTQLGRIKRMTCLAITGLSNRPPTAAIEVLLNLTPLDLLIMAKTRFALYRLHIIKQPAASEAEAVLLSVWKDVSDPVLDMRSDHTIPVYYNSMIFMAIIYWHYWRNKDPVFPENALMWFTDSSRVSSGTGSGIFGVRLDRNLSFLWVTLPQSFKLKYMPTYKLHM